ncbi:MAG TPA: thiamine pyrophosphate-dependent enzyme [Rectinemataceae bacterium]|nr:thiamine pyrophosphate-dependent enzyme [Rectinemataceae bacterium]
METEMLMGAEAIALGALHAGLSAAFAYPGTPSTEIMECLQDIAAREGGFVAQWCSNEKTAFESSLGASYAGRRTMVSMKHVGLNVAADPFVNSALLKVNGGLVVVVADDPGMHSSQDEQDSRWYADFARVPCLEPSDSQEAYDMVREAFELSERKACPVLLRIVTRLAHGRSSVAFSPRIAQKPVSKARDRWGWNLMPAVARKLWSELLGKYEGIRSEIEAGSRIEAGSAELGVITTGLALQYYRENEAELGQRPSHLHIARYPIPHAALRELASRVKRILVLEEGYPFVERHLRGVLDPALPIAGKESGEVPLTGELSPDSIRPALGLPAREGQAGRGLVPPRRPPQLCAGCPHGDSFSFLTEALKGHQVFTVNADIGCYTLGALPPYNAVETVVEMGASFGMARGASESGLRPAVGVIGDSTFYHSGIPNLVDAVSHGTNVKFMILDNATTGMTGAQPTIMPSERLKAIALAVGVDPAHVHIVKAHRTEHAANVALLKRELEYEGVSVVIAFRECIEALKKARKA